MRTPKHDWLKRQTTPQEKESCAFWPIKLMRRETGGIDRRKIDPDFAERLHHVAVQQDATIATDLREFADRLNYASFVIRGHD